MYYVAPIFIYTWLFSSSFEMSNVLCEAEGLIVAVLE
jgi:hypothetical protein